MPIRGFLGKKTFNLPDNRLVMGIQGGANGLVFKNNLADPMPIKIAGGKTLEQCVVEETEDYVLYSDGTPVVVQNYVSGTYDLYLERLNSESEAVPMLYVEGEPVIDHAKLLQDINNAQLERLANEPMTIPDDEEYVAPILEPRTIPVPIDFCCRVDKKTGEIYIGEGYENLCLSQNNFPVGTLSRNSNGYLEMDSGSWDGTARAVGLRSQSTLPETYYCASAELKSNYPNNSIRLVKNSNAFSKRIEHQLDILGYAKEEGITKTVVTDGYSMYLIGFDITQSQKSVVKFQITKTSTPKPFIRTIMPSGKLSFVTGATSLSHSFVVKEYSINKNINRSGNFYSNNLIITQGVQNNFGESLETVNTENSKAFGETQTLLLSNGKIVSHGVNDSVILTNKFSSKGLINLTYRHTAFLDHGVGATSFKQFLIYKGSLTESELKAENDKVIDLERVVL